MLTTVPITVTLLNPNGQPVKDCYVKASLTQMDSDAATGLVFSSEVEGVTNNSGSVSLNLWPNALGVTGSQYRFRAWDPSSGKRLLDEVATVPEYAANLRDIVLLPAPSPLPYDEASILAIQQSRTEAVAAAATAEGFKNDAEAILPLVSQSANDAHAAAAAAEQAQIHAENAVDGIAQFATEAEDSASLSLQHAQSAEVSKLQADQRAIQTASDAQLTAADVIATEENKISALQAATEAELSAQRVEGESLTVGQVAAEARLSATHAEQSKARASQSANDAELSHNLSRDYRDDSRAAAARSRVYRESARRWAQEHEGVPVKQEDGEEPQYSAMHWALIAMRGAASSLKNPKIDDDVTSLESLWSSQKVVNEILLEAQAREDADTLLQEGLDIEIQAREDADTLLQDNIDIEEFERISKDDQLQEDLTTEVEARILEMQNEVIAREEADLILQQDIDAEQLARIQDDETEQLARIAADEAIQLDLDTFKDDVNNDYYKKSGGAIGGDVSIAGNLFVKGETVQVDSQISTAERKIILNDGEVGPGITGEFSGLEVDRGTKDNYYLGFSENQDAFVVGKTGNLQPVAAREDAPLDGKFAAWSAAAKRFITRMIKWSDIDEDDDTLPASKIKQSTSRLFITSVEQNKLSLIEDEANKTIVSQVSGASETEVLSQNAVDKHYMGRRKNGIALLISDIDDVTLPTNLYRISPSAIGTYPYPSFTRGGATIEIVKWDTDSCNQTIRENRDHGRVWVRIIAGGIIRPWSEVLQDANVKQDAGDSELNIMSQKAVKDRLATKVDKDGDKTLTDVNFSQEDKDKLDSISAVVTQEPGNSLEEIMSQDASTKHFIGRSETGEALQAENIDDLTLATGMYSITATTAGTFPYTLFTKEGTFSVEKFSDTAGSQTIREHKDNGRQWTRIFKGGVLRPWIEQVTTDNVNLVDGIKSYQIVVVGGCLGLKER